MQHMICKKIKWKEFEDHGFTWCSVCSPKILDHLNASNRTPILIGDCNTIENQHADIGTHDHTTTLSYAVSYMDGDVFDEGDFWQLTNSARRKIIRRITESGEGKR